jgi:hypothetical protein
MGLFSREHHTNVPPAVLGMLDSFGESQLNARATGRPLSDPRFTSLGDLSSRPFHHVLRKSSPGRTRLL